MKRIVLVLGFIISLVLVSCSKQADSLAGTKWLGAEAPNVTFIATSMKDSYGNVQVGGGSFTGVVNGKTMILNAPGVSSARFIKQ